MNDYGKYYEGLVETYVKIDTRKYPVSEKRSAAGEGLSVGLAQCHKYPGSEYYYVIKSIKDYIEKGYKDYWNPSKIESRYSLDKFFREGDAEIAETKLKQLHTNKDYIENVVCYHEFYDSLESDLRSVFFMLNSGYYLDEICEYKKISMEELMDKLKLILNQYYAYFFAN